MQQTHENVKIVGIILNITQYETLINCKKQICCCSVLLLWNSANITEWIRQLVKQLTAVAQVPWHD